MRKRRTTVKIDWRHHAALLLLRCSTALLLFLHGVPKLFSFSAKVHFMPDFLGLGKELTLGFVIFAEVFCALFVLVGFFTRLATLPLIVLFLYIIFFIHGGKDIAESESALLYLMTSLAILLLGAGKHSLDHYFSLPLR